MMKPMILISALCFAYTAVAKWPKSAQPFARADLAPRSGSEVQGTADFAKIGKDLIVKVSAKKLSAGMHGIHLHEKGDCSSADASSAGDHFNPTNQKHGGPRSRSRHVGDFGNLVANQLGNAELEMRIALPAPNFAWDQILGKSLVVHEKMDDLLTQPSGNSGRRLACGVLRPLKPISE